MELLEERIRRDGVVKSEGVLKVDGFLNHQMDINLFNEMGKELKRLFADAPINKILTIEASGIGIAAVVAQHFDVPVVFAKKSQSINLDGDVYSTKIQSFTHQRIYDVIVSKKFLSADDHVLLIDDFLAKRLRPERPHRLGRGRGRHGRGHRHRRGEGFPARRRRSAQPRLPSGVAGNRAVHEPGNR